MALKDFYQSANFMTLVNTPDGMGGYEVVEQVGAEFQAAFSSPTTAEQQVAAQRGLEIAYNIRSTEDLKLTRDSKIRYKGDLYRVVSYGDMGQPPATIQLFGGQIARVEV